MLRTSQTLKTSCKPADETIQQHRGQAVSVLALRRSLAIVLSLLVCVLAGTYAVNAQQQLAPVINLDTRNRIPDQYIVVFKPATSRDAIRDAENTVKRLGGAVLFSYTKALLGFSAKLPAEALQALRANRRVAYIEADRMGSVDTAQNNPPTGLDRTSERLLRLPPETPLDNRYTYSETGAGVHAYVLDTGIRTTHPDFGGRASGAFDAVGGGTDDCHGHGTHVAGTLGGTTFGIAKQVTLHAVRVAQCNGSVSGAAAIAGVDWVRNNAIQPAVANMSLRFVGAFAALETSVAAAVASGVTFVVAAGNDSVDACGISPAREPTAITVGAVDPSNDTRPGFSNFGTCLDLFGPGVGIVSAMPDGLAAIPGCTIISNTLGSRTQSCPGTSMASPHVAGVAARFLENHTMATPAAVLAAIHNAANVTATAGWPGITNPGAGSPNELLHWGSLNDGFNDGDPHITTVDGVHYDFQTAGEFVSLRNGSDMEIQTRQTPIATTFTVANPYTGLATCVSLNTAVAARVGSRRVTFQPNSSGVPDPSGLQLRIDGVVTVLGSDGLSLGPGGRVSRSDGGGIQIDFPDGTVLIVTPGFWTSQGKWYLYLAVLNTPAQEGIMGATAPGSWLPALSNGSALGPMPASLHQRYLDLNQTFANSWRVTNATSLFDYAPGESTATFTFPSWPNETLPCVVPQQPTAKPLDLSVAKQLCREIKDKNMNEACVFDVAVTGERGFAKTYQIAQRTRARSTTITLTSDKDPTKYGEQVEFIATVDKIVAGGKKAPSGAVQFIVDGVKVGKSVKLDSDGRAMWKTRDLKVGNHQVTAKYRPGMHSSYDDSTSANRGHTVKSVN